MPSQFFRCLRTAVLVGAELAGSAARAVQCNQTTHCEGLRRKCGERTVWSVAGECTPPPLGHFGEADLDLNLSDGEAALLRIDLAFEGL